ncbi:MAG: ATP-dependent protease ATPase subunit HslU [Deltaproteobacteria bacterium]|nr:MAG: ATP-dependent protease ATPase subunit HslU [Deltaproteobacteria bacterium]
MTTTLDPRHPTPREIVAELDRYVIGQAAAKKAVAIAMRNRFRRQMLPDRLRDEVKPKNIVMVGPTGVGKTEIARRLARLAKAPFLKVEVTKFTEVGYVGRDVDSIVRDLVEVSARLVRAELLADVRGEAARRAEDRILDVLLPRGEAPAGEDAAASRRTRERMRELLRAGKLDDREVEIDVAEAPPDLGGLVLGGTGGADPLAGIRDALERLGGNRRRTRRVSVRRALEVLTEEEADKLIDRERLSREAVDRAERFGMVFLDEFDKICVRSDRGAAGEVSREGVQRDLLPLVEGTTVQTRYGSVRTDHVLFVAAGAFHVAKVSDLIPELQGRFPIRVELASLGREEFVRILTETDACLIEQYKALLATEGVEVAFTDDAVAAIADAAAEANAALENIGARRLHTVLERVLEELSFEASEMPGQKVTIDAAYVRARLEPVLADRDLARHIL